MQLQLRRNDFLATGVFGELLDESGKHICFTLEHAYPYDLTFTAKIPRGTYQCVRGIHHPAGHTIETFEITGVLGHSGILFHRGNYNADSDGCILLGLIRVGNTSLLKSNEAFAIFMAGLQGINSFSLIVL